MKIKVAQFGLGPIGLETLKLAATKPWADIVGGVDIDPAKIGKDLGALTGVKELRGRVVWASLEELLANGRPQVVFHTSVSNSKTRSRRLSRWHAAASAWFLRAKSCSSPACVTRPWPRSSSESARNPARALSAPA